MLALCKIASNAQNYIARSVHPAFTAKKRASCKKSVYISQQTVTTSLYGNAFQQPAIAC